MTNEEKMSLLNELLTFEENSKLFNLTSTERAEFQIWVKEQTERPKGEWIPIKVRPLTDEEKEYYTEHEYPADFMMMYDCPMPDDGQEVLITTSTGYVTTDTYYIDEGGYFENYCDEGDVKAWMPKPEPYEAESEVKPNE